MCDFESTLRKLTVRDDQFLESILAHDDESVDASQIDAKAHALVRLGALIAVDAGPPSYMSAVNAALASGASPSEVVGTLIAVMPVVGTARVVSAAPNLGLALGYDVSVALEDCDE